MTTETLISPQVTPERLQSLINPESIALVGASDRSQWTQMVLDSLEGYGFDATMHLVNRRGGTVRGRPSPVSCEAIGEPVGLAALMLPAHAVHDGLRDVAAAGIRNVIVLASGMGEGGGAEAAAAQAEVLALARELDLLMLGPNSLGMMNMLDRTGAWFAPPPEVIVRGGVAIVTQSGAIGHSFTRFTASQLIGLSHVVATGNEAMIDTVDITGALLEDERVRAVAVFCEAIKRPARLQEVAARALELGKAIVMLKAGSSELSAHLAMSHTGALVGDDGVIDAALRGNGVIRVKSVEELAITAGLIAHTGPLKRGGLGVLSISGGACDLVADRAQEMGLELPPLAEARRAELPAELSGHNPLDVTGLVLGDPDLIDHAIAPFRDDDGIALVAYGQVLPDLNFQPPGEPYWRRLAPAMGTLGRRGVLFEQTTQTIDPAVAELVKGLGVPYISGGLDITLKAIGHDFWWSERVRRHTEAANVERAAPAELDGGTGQWSEAQALAVLADQGVPIVPWRVARSRDEAIAAAAEIDGPVVVKLVSAGVAHKMDIGGVALDVRGAEAVGAAYDRVTSAAASVGAEAEGAIVAAMRSGGVELIVGVVRDELWGHVLAVGIGGLWVNVMDDKSLRVLPVDRAGVRDMLGELRGAALLEGARGAEAVDLDRLADVVLAIADVAVGLGDNLDSLEVNPLLARGAEIEVLDALATWRS